jgi:hypothetical protein
MFSSVVLLVDLPVIISGVLGLVLVAFPVLYFLRQKRSSGAKNLTAGAATTLDDGAAIRAAEEARLEEDARRAEEIRRAEEKRQAEEARQAEAARRAEEARLAEEARQAEAARRAEEARLAEEARQAEAARRAEEARLAEEARRAEEARLAEEARRAQEVRERSPQPIFEIPPDDPVASLNQEVLEPEPVYFVPPSEPSSAPPSVVAAEPAVALKGSEGAHKVAQRVARTIVSDIKIYNPQKIEQGCLSKNLYDLLKKEFDSGIRTYDERVEPVVKTESNYLYENIVKTLCNGDPSCLGPNFPMDKFR